MKKGILTGRPSIFGTIQSKIDRFYTQVNLNKTKFNYCTSSGNCGNFRTRILLSVSAYFDYELHLEQSKDSCLINNDFVPGVQGFAANLDM